MYDKMLGILIDTNFVFVSIKLVHDLTKKFY